MNQHNIGQALQLIDLSATSTATATGNGTGVDLSSYVGDFAVILSAKANGGTTPTMDVKIQDSADNTTFADVTGATFTQVTDAGTSAAVVFKISLLSSVRRYVRVVRTIGGTTPSFIFSVVGVGLKQVR